MWLQWETQYCISLKMSTVVFNYIPTFQTGKAPNLSYAVGNTEYSNKTITQFKAYLVIAFMI